MSHPTPSADSLHHHSQRMAGRDPHEEHRVASNLELLFDLTFASAFGIAAYQFSHAVTEGHYSSGIISFAFASFAICWAWINFSWFASAYDNDDWIFRVVTMIQMLGVLVLAVGLPRMYISVEKGAHLDNSVMVFGYVIMRAAMLFQWLRAAKHDPPRRRACLTYAAAILVAQVGWVLQIFFDFAVQTNLILVAALILVEMSGPYFAERTDGGTPWHAHHIAERYGLFAIIALGEGIIGTVLTLTAVLEKQGWTTDSVLIGLAGTGLTFGVWWVYYLLPAADVLHKHRERSFVWGYGQIVIVAAIVAIGAGLHVAAYFLEHKSHIGVVPTVLSVAIPVTVYLATIYSLYYYMLQKFDPLHMWLLLLTALVIAGSVFAAYSGVGVAICLVILSLAPAVSVVGYEIWGHRHLARAQSRTFDG